jgi:hypothetical protein
MSEAFQIFIAQPKRFYFPRELGILFIWILSFISIYFLQDIGILLLVITLITTIVLMVTRFFSYKPLKGILSGELKFDNDAFYIDFDKYILTEITKADFQLSDYYGHRDVPIGRSEIFKSVRSQGVDNYFEYTDIGQESYLVYFKLKDQYDYRRLLPFIIELVKHKKMPLLKALELMNITKEAEIQEFKSVL